MTTKDLRDKILEKCEARLNGEVTMNDLKDLATIYNSLTERDWLNNSCFTAPYGFGGPGVSAVSEGLPSTNGH